MHLISGVLEKHLKSCTVVLSVSFMSHEVDSSCKL